MYRLSQQINNITSKHVNVYITNSNGTRQTDRVTTPQE